MHTIKAWITKDIVGYRMWMGKKPDKSFNIFEVSGLRTNTQDILADGAIEICDKYGNKLFNLQNGEIIRVNIAVGVAPKGTK